jgi:hypothetical protein
MKTYKIKKKLVLNFLTRQEQKNILVDQGELHVDNNKVYFVDRLGIKTMTNNTSAIIAPLLKQGKIV